MGLRTAGLTCAGLWMGAIAAAEVAPPLDVPPALASLLAAVTGVPDAGPLRVTGIEGSDGVGSGMGSIGTEEGNPLLTIVASGGSRDGDSFLADRVEIWRDEPLLSGDGVRITVDGERVSASAEGIHHTGSFGRIGTALSAGRSSATFTGADAEIAVELETPNGRIVPAARPDSTLAWSAARAVFLGNPAVGRPLHLRMESISFEMGAGRTAGASSLEIETDSAGSWHFRLDGLAVSAGLADRFRPISGLEPPPVSLKMTILPKGAAGRRGFSSVVGAGTAELRIEGWLEEEVVGGVARADAAGLLRFLADAGSADPLAAAAAMGLHYDQAGQDADRTSWPEPQ